MHLSKAHDQFNNL